MYDYIIHRVMPDGGEDPMWWTEKAGEITEVEAVNRWAELCLGSNQNYRLYQIDRSQPRPNKAELILERPQGEMVVVKTVRPLWSP
jgi:hypothetical protein